MVGQLFENRYQLISELGIGGMAIVYKARDNVLGRLVAIKMLKKEFLGDQDFTERFVIEARAAAALSHQNLVSIYDVGKSIEGVDYIVMEFVEGVTLKEYVKRNKMLSWQEATEIVEQILLGIRHAHERGIVHRDLKPQNIMVTPAKRIKVMDFGIARAASTYTVKVGDATVGSVHYFSPEQARGRHTDERSDIYSLGIVYYEMLTGIVPFDGDNPVAIAMMHLQAVPKQPKEYNLSIPLSVEDVVMKAIRKDTFERYQSASEMISDIEAIKKSPENSPVADKPRDTSGDTRIIMPITREKLNQANSENLETILSEDQNMSRFDSPQGYTPHTKAAQKQQSKKKGDYDEKSKKLNGWALASTIFLLLTIIVVSTLLLFPGIFKGGKEIAVPDLVGLTLEEATLKAEEIGATISYRKESSNTAPANSIISQNPIAGKRVKLPLEISIVISEGVKIVTVPNMTSFSESDAEAKLKELGLFVSRDYQSSATLELGKVIETKPKAGSQMNSGEVITLIISRGQNGVEIAMPNLIGLTQTQVEAILKEKNLNLGTVSFEDNLSPAGTVIKQSVDAITNVMEFSKIDIVISTGRVTPSPTPSQNTVVPSVNPGGSPLPQGL